MQQTPPCHDCVERQVHRVFEVAFTQPEAAAWSSAERAGMIEEVLEEARAWVKAQPLDLTPAELSFEPIKMVYRKTGIADPYISLKDASNEEAMAHLPRFREWINDSERPLETAARMAVAGNIIDLGIHRDYDIEASVQHILDEGFAINHIDLLLEDLREAERCGIQKTLLYICDNAGEIAFDRLYIETLQKHFPSLEIVAGVNSGPVLNDALMGDAESVGLRALVKVIENGYDLLGTVLDRVSSEFLEAFNRADWVISKGQANYETLDGSSSKVLFLLKAKCEPIANYIGVRMLQGVFKQDQPNGSGE